MNDQANFQNFWFGNPNHVTDSLRFGLVLLLHVVLSQNLIF